ncbi:GSCOCG00011427001-RA-CDS [Cotesia congregata]|nr:GSCOCG00011427001-RA-CDS [Cotesia congregata]
MRTFIRRADNLEKNTAVLNKIEVAKNKNLSKVYKHWELSYNLREADYVNKNFQDITEILKLWPILKESYGYQLIEEDFNRKYSAAKDKLLVGWKQFYNKISKVSDNKSLPQQAVENKKLLENPDLSDETKSIIEFHY